MEAARRLDDQADRRAGVNVEAALVDQMLIHHGVEIGVVSHVVDVAVHVVIHPSRRDRQKAWIVRAAGCRPGAHSALSTRSRASNSSIQCWTGSFAPLARCT